MQHSDLRRQMYFQNVKGRVFSIFSAFHFYYFYLSFFCYIAATYCSTLAFSMDWIDASSFIQTILQATSIVMLSFHVILRGQFRINYETVLEVLLLLLGVACSLTASYYSFFWLIVFSVEGRRADMHIVARIVLALSLFTILFGAVGCYLGFLESVVSEGSRSRFALGLSHPNLSGLMFFTFYVAYSYIRFSAFSFLDYLIGFCCALTVWFTSQSRTAAFILCLLMLGVYIVKRLNQGEMIEHYSKIIRLLALGTVLAVIFLSIIFMFAYDSANPIDDFLNRLLSGRLYYLNYAWDYFPPKLFGQNLNSVEIVNYWEGVTWISKGLLLDNAIGNLLVRHGYIAMILTVGASLLYVKRGVIVDSLINEQVLFFLIFFIYGLFEQYAFNIAFNFLLICMFTSTNRKKPKFVTERPECVYRL